MQSFLGLCSYFRKFVENFSVIAKSLYYSIRKNADFRFEKAEKQAIEALKDRLVNASILSILYILQGAKPNYTVMRAQLVLSRS